MNRYLLDRAKLRRGDIVLQAGSKPHSKAIMLATRGSYSHALLYDNNSMIEATLSGGVFSKNPQRILVKDPEHLAVYRMRAPLNSKSLDLVLATARQKIAAPYAPMEAIRVAFSSRHAHGSSRQFCSRLVAQSYAEAGIHLVPNAAFCSPHDLAQSPLLEQIHDVVKPANPEDIKVYESVDINLRNCKATLRWVRRARELAARENQEIVSQSDVLRFLIDHPQHNDAVVKCMRSTTYLHNFEHDRTANPYRYSDADFLNILIANSHQADSIIATEIEKEPPLIQRYGLNLMAMRQHASSGLSYVEDHIQLYDALLAQTEERLEVIICTLRKIGLAMGEHAMNASQLLKSAHEARS